MNIIFNNVTATVENFDDFLPKHDFKDSGYERIAQTFLVRYRSLYGGEDQWNVV